MNTTTMKTSILCPCGGEPSAESIELAEWLPSYVALCPACEARAAAAERDASNHAGAAAEAQKLARRLSVIPPEIAATSTQDPRFNAALWLSVRDWTPECGKWVGIVGRPGTCKTRCLGLLARKLIDAGRSVTWVTACEFQDLVEELGSKRSAVSEPARARLREIRTADVLVFDDLGKNTWSDAIERHLFQLVDHRKTNLLPVLWSANATLREMLASGGMSLERGGPTIGRLMEKSHQIIVRGDGNTVPRETESNARP